MPDEFEEQHPIPQDISSYQFKLVGDMTLKQFLQVAGGALVALAFYASPLHPAIKWPLIIISSLLGVALAFFPIEDRPLGKWILIFFRSIYSPTIFIWKRSDKPYNFFQAEGVPTAAQVPQKPEPAVVYIAPGPAPDATAEQEQKAMIKLEQKEVSFLSKMSKLFNVSTLLGRPTVPQAPTTAHTYIEPGTAPQQTTPSLRSNLPINYPRSSQQGTILSSQKPEEGPAVQPDIQTTKRELKIPEPITLTVEPTHKQADGEPGKPESIGKEDLQSVISSVTPAYGQTFTITGQQARFSADAAPPIPPTIPDVIVGQVVDPDGKIVEGAILEIRDEAGRPVRALKSNKLGHFMIVTPLMEGKYEIITEKEGLVFDPVTFVAQAKVVPPIAIWAKNKADGSNSEQQNKQ